MPPAIQPEPSYSFGAETEEALKRYSIVAVPSHSFEYGGYRYTNIKDAIAEARRSSRVGHDVVHRAGSEIGTTERLSVRCPGVLVKPLSDVAALPVSADEEFIPHSFNSGSSVDQTSPPDHLWDDQSENPDRGKAAE